MSYSRPGDYRGFGYQGTGSDDSGFDQSNPASGMQSFGGDDYGGAGRQAGGYQNGGYQGGGLQGNTFQGGYQPQGEMQRGYGNYSQDIDEGRHRRRDRDEGYRADERRGYRKDAGFQDRGYGSQGPPYASSGPYARYDERGYDDYQTGCSPEGCPDDPYGMPSSRPPYDQQQGQQYGGQNKPGLLQRAKNIYHDVENIEHLGTISSIVRDTGGCTLVISQSAEILDDCHIGDSIAVNGACLTVTKFHKTEHGGWFEVWLANETLDRTDLGERKVGDQVNLERAMGAHVRFGGHFVQAHVDGTASIVDRVPDGDSLRLTFQFPEPTPERPSLLPYLVPKGYVTIDGASLTLTGVNDAERKFSVMLIQHTQQKITLSKKEIGAKVNIEPDMVGKYVEKSVVASLSGSGSEGLRNMIEKVVEDVLARKGL
ncbi:hypothetical protein CVT24_009778 [Panaeolus cyanescens]|uniref:Riboflavin synthase n=1 Tax=Panaeolus cyanescens TaxID=181874 RepID=A0A409VAE3_9AGAR|nr:hypothetical protein CVT24_009778 [Panaeolus cyanescens]